MNKFKLAILTIMLSTTAFAQENKPIPTKGLAVNEAHGHFLRP